MIDKAKIVAWLRNRAEDKRRDAAHAEENRDDWFSTMPPEISAGWLDDSKMLGAAADLIALPTHPQDAEVREGLAACIVEYFGYGSNDAIEFGPNKGVLIKPRSIADAILAYLHQQGFRRVGEGEVVVPREPSPAMLHAGFGTADDANSWRWEAMLSASERGGA